MNSGNAALALTMGDPAGIGPDLSLVAWRDREKLQLPPFFLLGDPDLLGARARMLKLDIPLVETKPERAASDFASALPVLPIKVEAQVQAGQPNSANAGAVIEAIRCAVELTMAGRARAVVTNPISKSVLYSAGFEFPGHTEYLAHLAGDALGRAITPIMLLAGPELRVAPVTIHIPLSEVPAALTTKAIVEAARIMSQDLSLRFGFDRPRIAISGLNPHAGEDGTLGTEDGTIIAPAVEELRAVGIDAVGPLPADTMFHAEARATYDAALCMYHDQALIPAKTLGFHDSVNATLGLPFVRTSPDHGTAFSLAGTGTARPDSLIAALRLASAMANAESQRRSSAA